jgi:fructose-bisphosphate aldolase class 1
MNTQYLIEIASNLVAADKGALAVDESNPTCHKRFSKLGIPQTMHVRRDYEGCETTPASSSYQVGGLRRTIHHVTNPAPAQIIAPTAMVHGTPTA